MHKVELRHLRYFLTVVEEGSFTRAAERLLTSQPSLSRQVRDLEHELGDQLLIRTPRGISLTAAGEALVQHARQLLQLEASTKAVVSQAGQRLQRIRLGLAPGIDSIQVGAIVSKVGLTLPQVVLAINEVGSAEQLRLLGIGELDLAIVRFNPLAGGFRHWLLWEEPIGLAIRPGHRLASLNSYDVTDLGGLSVVAHSREQIPFREDILVTATENQRVAPLWHFMRFTEHPQLIADAVRADAVMLGEQSARLRLPSWPWHPFKDVRLSIGAYLIAPSSLPKSADAVAQAIIDCFK